MNYSFLLFFILFVSASLIDILCFLSSNGMLMIPDKVIMCNIYKVEFTVLIFVH